MMCPFLQSQFERAAMAMGLRAGVFAESNGQYCNEHVQWLWEQFQRRHGA